MTSVHMIVNVTMTITVKLSALVPGAATSAKAVSPTLHVARKRGQKGGIVFSQAKTVGPFLRCLGGVNTLADARERRRERRPSHRGGGPNQIAAACRSMGSGVPRYAQGDASSLARFKRLKRYTDVEGTAVVRIGCQGAGRVNRAGRMLAALPESQARNTLDSRVCRNPYRLAGAPVSEEAVDGVGDAGEVGGHEPGRLADLRARTREEKGGDVGGSEGGSVRA